MQDDSVDMCFPANSGHHPWKKDIMWHLFLFNLNSKILRWFILILAFGKDFNIWWLTLQAIWRETSCQSARAPRNCDQNQWLSFNQNTVSSGWFPVSVHFVWIEQEVDGCAILSLILQSNVNALGCSLNAQTCSVPSASACVWQCASDVSVNCFVAETAQVKRNWCRSHLVTFYWGTTVLMWYDSVVNINHEHVYDTKYLHCTFNSASLWSVLW